MLTLQEKSLNWALNHVLMMGDTDIFPIPFEYEAIKHDWNNLRYFLSHQNILEWRTRPHRILIAPKGRYGFRVITQLDPLDFLIYASVIYEIGHDIEKRRIPEIYNMVFSYRFLPDTKGRVFKTNVGYSQFQEQSTHLIDEQGITYVAITDIADFYQSIYLHRLENALYSATNRTSHVKAIMNLLSGWNETETYGIPVGNAPSRLLAEMTISDIDESLIANEITFLRYNDDYRIFAKSQSEAYRNIAFLATILNQNHGLTLQPQKTTIVKKEEFRRRYLPDPEDRELFALDEKFKDLVSELGLDNPYEEINYDDLTEEQKALVDSLNLINMFKDEIKTSGEPDSILLKFILRRMGQLGDSCLCDDIFDNIDVLYPVFPDIIRYFQRLRDLSSKDRIKIGERVIHLLKDSIVSELEYHCMWALDLFTHSTEWDNEGHFLKLLNSSHDLSSRRKLILAMVCRASQQYWFKSKWRGLFDESPWPRRALIAVASCMPSDARNHWYRSIEPRLDHLEKAVMRWAKDNPF